jgi:catechol 2,3-dioxygenase-like lactoylglutathione lyase family enzyme
MKQKLGYIALRVCVYDEAIRYYTQKLGFKLVENTNLGPGKRWGLVAISGICWR